MPKASGKQRQSVKTQQRKPNAREVGAFKEAHKAGTLRSAGIAESVWWHSCPRTKAVAFLARKTTGCGRCGLALVEVERFLHEQVTLAEENGR